MNKKRPNIVHPTIPGAIGSINSPYLEGRNKEEEAKLIIDDIVDLLKGNTSPEGVTGKPCSGKKTGDRKKS